MKVTRDGHDFTVDVTADGEGLVSHAGSALLAQVADKTGLTQALSLRLAGLKARRSGHDPGRVIRDLAVMLADGGDCLADFGALGDQHALFGGVASSSTAFRVVDRIASQPRLLDALRDAHARARERARTLIGAPERLTIDMDATLITSHSDNRAPRAPSKAVTSLTRCSFTQIRRRGARRRAAPGQRRCEHRRRPDRRRRAGA